MITKSSQKETLRNELGPSSDCGIWEDSIISYVVISSQWLQLHQCAIILLRPKRRIATDGMIKPKAWRGETGKRHKEPNNNNNQKNQTDAK
jgi:hypothetical protein